MADKDAVVNLEAPGHTCVVGWCTVKNCPGNLVYSPIKEV